MAVNRPDFVNQILEMWGRLELRQKAMIIAFAALGIILVVSVVYYANRVEYQTLYRDLNSEDAREIVARLEEDQRKFQVRGTSILVAASRDEIEKMRLDFSGAGLGRSGLIGYEVFDKSQFGMTDFTEQVNLQRALQGELERTISRIAEVSTARVHIVLTKDSYFEEARTPAKASVMLVLKNGAILSKTSIAGIRGVVAGAVPGLNVQNVSIIDDEGRVLAQSAESGDMTRTDLEMEMSVREQMEKDIANKASAILEPYVGRRNVQVNTSVEIDTNATQQTEELFVPNPQAVVSHQRIEERAGGNVIDAGIPGTQSNAGMAEMGQLLVGPDRFRESETTNYEVGKTVRTTIQPKGTLRRLSVAVTLNHKTIVTKTDDGTMTTKEEPYSDTELADFRELVMAAVGYNEQRGDVVTIRTAPFYDENALRDAVPVSWYDRFKNQEFFVPLMKYLMLALVLLLAYLIFVRPLRKRVIAVIDASAPALPPAAENLLLEGAPEGALPASEEGMPAGLPEASEMEMFDMDNATEEQIEDMLANEEMGQGNARRYAIIKKRLIDKARKNPELVSQLIRSLMQEKA